MSVWHCQCGWSGQGDHSHEVANMSRQSTDEVKDGRVYNGFDYSLQVWVIDGIIQPVGQGRALAGQSIYQVKEAEKR